MMKILRHLRLAHTVLICLCVSLITAQSKKALDHPDFAIWNQIMHTEITPDGSWISYELVPGEGDHTLVFYQVSEEKEYRFHRGEKCEFSDDGIYAVFTLAAPEDSIKSERRRKVEKEKLTPDTLAILHLPTGEIQKIADLESTEMPQRWSGFIAYQVRPAQIEPEEEKKEENKEGEEGDGKKKKKEKSASEKNGYPLIIRNLLTQKEDTLPFVTDYALSKYGNTIAALSTGIDSVMNAGVYVYDCDMPTWNAIKTQKGKYKQLCWSESGDQLVFLGDVDTTKAQLRPFAMYRWKPDMDSADIFIDHHAPFMTTGWILSEHYDLKFSKDGTKLHFGIAPEPMEEDTTLLDEEKVSVEVWHYLDKRLYTQQNVRSKSEKERSYHCVADLKKEVFRQIADEHFKDSRMDPDGNSPYAILMDEDPYLRESSWTGQTLRDVSTYDIATGRHTELAKGVEGSPQLSPNFKYLYWYNAPDSAWFVSTIKGQPQNISAKIPTPVFDELNDVPANPDSYGIAGWTSGDSAVLIYDRYDIWKIDLLHPNTPLNLTKGREYKIRYRNIRLDPEDRYIDPAKPLLLSIFDESSKASGYAQLNLRTGELRFLLNNKMQYDKTPLKARDAEVLIFTGETFEQFPDLMVTTDRFATSKKISNANPQQAEYLWGSIELFEWTSFDGKPLQGLVVKPEGFDPTKTYPLIVNFYERSSDGLFQHRAPFPHRSTINYTFYASRGYVIFNPDIVYETGHPGDDAFNCAVSGTQALMREGFIDPQRMALQGHSWGGYQIAHILTKTGIYKCAEAGAVVVNMTSAYGGIRWETGLSRMFQYEHQQSRIGGTLWEKPELYVASSPLFQLDKISTPVLILQNDSDGHVPWYQGIEFFTAMRRLGKPAWLLNYNGEPHWPVKLQNRKDLNIRMQQFFDHYLMDAQMPKWMRDGVPAVEKGILQGYELIEKPNSHNGNR